MENGGWLVIPYPILIVRQALTSVESNVSLQLLIIAKFSYSYHQEAEKLNANVSSGPVQASTE